jgi:GDP-4-dehydro-6-deoxy-D-mannose reductase
MADAPGPILLTGGSGFVGRVLAPRLAAAYPGRDCVMASLHGAEPPAGWRGVQIDLAHGDVTGLVAALKPSVVLHLAARSSVQQAAGQAAFVFGDNLDAGLRLIEAVRAHAPRAAFLLASSGEVYGRAFASHPVAREDGPIGPANAYARSKAALEFAVQDLLGRDAPAVILRLFNHFGPGQDSRFVIPSFAAQLAAIAAGRMPPVVQVGNLDAERDFLAVEDVLDAYLRSLGRLAGQAAGVELFNIASGQGRAIRQVLDDLIAASGLAVRVEVDPARLRPSDIPRAVGDASRFAEATGWKPVTAWSEALGATYRSWLADARR